MDAMLLIELDADILESLDAEMDVLIGLNPQWTDKEIKLNREVLTLESKLFLATTLLDSFINKIGLILGRDY